MHLGADPGFLIGKSADPRSYKFYNVVIGGSKGGGALGTRAPPLGSKFFQFHAVLGKI